MFNREDIRQVSVLDNITDSRTELKLLACINRRVFVGSVIHALDYKRSYTLVLPTLMCYGPSYQLFVVSKISSIFHNKLLKVCRFEKKCMHGL